jgi:hypothetical protein
MIPVVNRVGVTLPGAFGSALTVAPTAHESREIGRLLAEAILEASRRWHPSPHNPIDYKDFSHE